MTRHTRDIRWILIVAAFALIPALAAHPDRGNTAPNPARQWSEKIWRSALEGNDAAVRKYLDAAPADGVSEASLNRFRESMELHEANASKALNDRTTSRDDAIEEMQAHLEADELSEALRAAVLVQTLGDDLNAVFADEDIQRIINWAQRRIPEVERDRDWLYAQELLFRLRTLYEDTTKVEQYTYFNDELERVNRRVGLLARYAPLRLHALREKRAERLGDDPPGPYVAPPGGGWEEQLEGIDHRMLKQSLKTAAREHIEAKGWRPLLEGGLESMRVLATTSALQETFPEIGDAARVGRWSNEVEREMARLAGEPDRKLDYGALSRVLDRIVKVNDQTLELPLEVICREFGDGAMFQLDRFSEVIWPDKLRRFRQATEGNFTGVGILIRNNEKGEIMVVNPLEGTPAYFAGVRPNDLIVEVEGKSTVGWSLNDAVDNITGPKSSVVTLGIKREGIEDMLQIAIERDVIKIHSVKGWHKVDLDPAGDPLWDWYIDPVSRIAYIRLTQFTEDTHEDLRVAWDQINEHGRPNGVILDLRHNPGGLLTSAVHVSNLFVRRGVIVSGEDKFEQKAWPDQRANPARADMAGVPTVVIINEGSASASEIVAGCLQAHQAAVVIGKRSYGKGSVQTVHPITRDSALKLTTQYYRLPSVDGRTKGRIVHKRPGAEVWGVDPDIEVNMTPDQIIEAINLRQAADTIQAADAVEDDTEPRPDINELLSKGIDPQLQMALLILQARAIGEVDDETRHAMRD